MSISKRTFIYGQSGTFVENLGMTKAVGYYRVSTDKQGASGLGLESQQTAVQGFAKANGMVLTNEFTEVESGKKNNRPILLEALAYCKKHKAKLVIAKLDRLGRNVAFISNLMESKVPFVAVDNPQANEFILHIMAAFAEHERKMISERTIKALAAAKRRGVVLGANGKKLAKANKDASRDFARKNAPIINEIKGRGILTVRAISEELNRLNIPTFRKGSRWHKSSTHLLLKACVQ